MNRIVCTSNTPFPLDLIDTNDNPTKIEAGKNTVIITDQKGDIIYQRIKPYKYSLRTYLWHDIKQLAISHLIEGVCLGLLSDGTCMMSKGRFRYCEFDFHGIHKAVHSWKNVKQVAVNDSLFAVHEDGTVSHYYYMPYINLANHTDPYTAVDTWKNIDKIFVHIQGLIAGITTTGDVLLAGYLPDWCKHNDKRTELLPPYWDDQQGNETELLHFDHPIINICSTDSECYDMLFQDCTGNLLRFDGKIVGFSHPNDSNNMQSHFWHTYTCLNNNQQIIGEFGLNELKEASQWENVINYSIGNDENFIPFIVAIVSD